MKKAQFDELLMSVRQAGEIAAGRKPASRVFKVTPTKAKRRVPSKTR